MQCSCSCCIRLIREGILVQSVFDPGIVSEKYTENREKFSVPSEKTRRRKTIERRTWRTTGRERRSYRRIEERGERLSGSTCRSPVHTIGNGEGFHHSDGEVGAHWLSSLSFHCHVSTLAWRDESLTAQPFSYELPPWVSESLPRLKGNKISFWSFPPSLPMIIRTFEDTFV